jgi:hypothetical protein
MPASAHLAHVADPAPSGPNSAFPLHWLLYLDDLIASGEKIARFVTGHTLESFSAGYPDDAASPLESHVRGAEQMHRHRAATETRHASRKLELRFVTHSRCSTCKAP